MISFISQPMRIRKPRLFQVERCRHPVHFLDKASDAGLRSRCFLLFFFLLVDTISLARQLIADTRFAHLTWPLRKHDPMAEVLGQDHGCVIATRQHKSTQKIIDRDYLPLY